MTEIYFAKLDGSSAQQDQRDVERDLKKLTGNSIHAYHFSQFMEIRGASKENIPKIVDYMKQKGYELND